MRRDINWKTQRDDGTIYETRVTHFGKSFKFQFREKGSEQWDYRRPPDATDLATFLDTIQRRYARRTATHEELLRAEKMFKELKS